MSALMSWLSAAAWNLDAALNTELFVLQGYSVRVMTVLTIVVVLILTGMLSRWMRRLLARLADARSEEDQVALAHSQRMVHYLIALAGLWLALEAVGCASTPCWRRARWWRWGSALRCSPSPRAWWVGCCC